MRFISLYNFVPSIFYSDKYLASYSRDSQVFMWSARYFCPVLTKI
jgi:hypothetical protein